MATHINELLVTPLNEEDMENISWLAERYGCLINDAGTDSKKAEKFKWGLVVTVLLYVELIVKGYDSAVVGILNIEFAKGIGLFAIGYLGFMWRSLNKVSKNNYQCAADIRGEVEKRHGVRILMADCIAVNTEDCAYFFNVPSMLLTSRSKVRKPVGS